MPGVPSSGYPSRCLRLRSHAAARATAGCKMAMASGSGLSSGGTKVVRFELGGMGNSYCLGTKTAVAGILFPSMQPFMQQLKYSFY
jgi:hypothetical protein